MKLRHWSITNGSGLHGVAQSLVEAETKAGHDSALVDSMVESPAWEDAIDADVQIVHSHLPNGIQQKITKAKLRTVWIGHGTPDHVFQSSVEFAQSGGYGHPEPLMLMFHWLQHASARVTFWPRHQWIYSRMVDRGTVIDCIPLGVDRSFWCPGESRGKFAGTPSVFTAENPHYIKWPYDLFTLWPDVAEAVDGAMAKLHAIYVPRDMHSCVYPWTYRNGCSYSAFLSPMVFDKDGLRNAFRSTDYTIGLVRYGDFNQLSAQANAAGSTTISYRGNEYADYWITEGDQRTMRDELIAILDGTTPKRAKTPVPDISETAANMQRVYERIL